MSGHLNHRYLIALGSNVRHHRHGRPRVVLAAALEAMRDEGLDVICSAPVIVSRPLGPSRRAYANSAALVETPLMPEAMLEMLKDIEARFGRRRGQNWGARVLDCDIVLWDGGPWHGPHLTIPHPSFRDRDFVLGPAASIAPLWHDPLTGRTVRQLQAKLGKVKRIMAATHP